MSLLLGHRIVLSQSPERVQYELMPGLSFFPALEDAGKQKWLSSVFQRVKSVEKGQTQLYLPAKVVSLGKSESQPEHRNKYVYMSPSASQAANFMLATNNSDGLLELSFFGFGTKLSSKAKLEQFLKQLW